MESDVGNDGVDGRRFDGFMARPKLSDDIIVPRMEAPKKASPTEDEEEQLCNAKA